VAYDPEQFLRGVKAPFSRQNNFLDAGQYLVANNQYSATPQPPDMQSQSKVLPTTPPEKIPSKTDDDLVLELSDPSAIDKVKSSVADLSTALQTGQPTNNLPTFGTIKEAIDKGYIGQPVNIGNRQNILAFSADGYGLDDGEPDPGKYLSLKDRRDGGGPGYAGDVYGIGGGERADEDRDGYITFAENEKNPLDQNFLTGMSNAAYQLGQSVGSATSNLFGRSFDEDDYQGPAAPINDQVEIGGVRYNTKSDDSAYSAPADPKGNDGGFISFMDRFDGGGPGESRAEEIERGGGDGGFSRVICTELYKQGKLDMDLYRMDIVYTAKRLSPITVRGYHHWAVPMVVRMRSSTSLSNLFEYLTVARAKEIARIVKPESHKRTISGFLIKNIGEAICFSIGLFVGQKDWSVLYNGEANNG